MEKRSVLVVDPNIAIQTVAKLALRDHPVAVEGTTEALALQRAAELRSDLIVCAMGQVSDETLELCRALRIASPSAVILLLLSGKEKRAVVRAIRDAGVNEILIKPFTSQQFSECARRLLWPKEFGAEGLAYVCMTPCLARHAVERALRSWNLSIRRFATSDELEEADLRDRPLFTLYVSDAPLTSFDWYEPVTMGNLIVRAPKFPRVPSKLQKNVFVTSDPLSAALLDETIAQLLPEQSRRTPVTTPAAVSVSEKNRLCADLATALLELEIPPSDLGSTVGTVASALIKRQEAARRSFFVPES